MISDGTQTPQEQIILYFMFESDVISDGTQTLPNFNILSYLFESDVISDGTQTINYGRKDY